MRRSNLTCPWIDPRLLHAACKGRSNIEVRVLAIGDRRGPAAEARHSLSGMDAASRRRLAETLSFRDLDLSAQGDGSKGKQIRYYEIE